MAGGVAGGIAGVATGSAILPPAPIFGATIRGCSGATAGFVAGRQGAGFAYELGKGVGQNHCAGRL